MSPGHKAGRSHRHQTVVIIPTYNHGSRVEAVIAAVRRLHLPLIVVDDGSTDGTWQRLRACRGITRLRHRRNLGKGAALITGMRAARQASARWAITLDADGQHRAQDALVLLDAIPPKERPIVLGRRRIMTQAPWTSRAGREFSNFWVWVAGAPWLHDTQSGFRIYPLPETLGLGVRARRYQYEIEVLARAAWAGIPIIETPIEVIYQPGAARISHFRPGPDFIRNTATFYHLITHRVFTPRCWRRRRTGQNRRFIR
ncbi:MAG: glycosyltransferase family 2 protein [Desulfosarcinaceae bacterium]|nr:glycosyltransferase family 2 protein [Desulfosarcinaceae bacterium]